MSCKRTGRERRRRRKTTRTRTKRQRQRQRRCWWRTVDEIGNVKLERDSPFNEGEKKSVVNHRVEFKAEKRY